MPGSQDNSVPFKGELTKPSFTKQVEDYANGSLVAYPFDDLKEPAISLASFFASRSLASPTETRPLSPLVFQEYSLQPMTPVEMLPEHVSRIRRLGRRVLDFFKAPEGTGPASVITGPGFGIVSHAPLPNEQRPPKDPENPSPPWWVT